MAKEDLNQYKLNDTYSKKKTLLDQQHAQSKSALEMQKNQEQQAAAISYQKLMKYLPEYQKSMGLKGNGMSETALLDAAARYRSEQGRIASEYSSRQDDVDSQYRQNLLDLYSQAEAQEKQERQDRYNKAKDAIQSWQGSSEELTDYVMSLSGQVDDDDYAILKDIYTGMNEAIIQAKIDEDKAKAEEEKYQLTDISSFDLEKSGVDKDSTRGDNFTLNIGDAKYDVQLGGEINADSDAIKAATKAGVADGQVFMYDGDLYYMNGGKVHSIEKRFTHDTNNNDYKRLVAALTGQVTSPSETPKVNRYRSMR